MDNNEHRILQFPPPSPGYIPSNLPFFVVGIGASAGGIEPLKRFLEGMPSDNGMAFVIVLHLSPKHESHLDHILQSCTKMPVLQVAQTVPIQPNHVYIISPTLDLLMNDGHLQVVSAARPRGRHTAIDIFLRTVAEVHRERAVGIILSGAGSDGAVGIARIKEKGGITLAQLPDEAEFSSMPQSAIASRLVDFVLSVSEMPQKLYELSRNAAVLELPEAGDLEQPIIVDAVEAKAWGAERALHEILAILHSRTGHDFKHYKRATVLRRIERRLQVTALPDIVAYRDYLERTTDETTQLLQDMLISVTNFFRDRESFEALERDIIPKIFRDAGETEQIRAWSLACASGEEAYSIAILLAEQSTLAANPRSIQIFASDIDERAIDIARRGLYPDSIITDVTPSRLRQYFTQEHTHYCVNKKIRDHVLFASHNVLRDPPFSRLHLICCRNLLIYLSRDIQKHVFEMMHYALYPGGYLFLGSAETADTVPELFVPVDKKHRIYQATQAKRSFMAPQLVLGSRRPSISPVASVDTKEHREERRKTPQKQIHQRLLENYAPPNVLLNQDNDVVYSTKTAGRFLHQPGGEPSQNILAIAHPDLQLELRAALFEAGQSHKSVHTKYLPVQLNGKQSLVRMVILPGEDEDAGSGMTLLVFEEETDVSDLEVAPATVTTDKATRQLLNELAQTKEKLRSIIEEYETSMEDLKSSNEEGQAANEELRSTLEELETSKEELQSINEELLTVNAELKFKIDETSKAHDDLQNIIAATDVATIFIDRGMHIKRYTKPCTKIFNLIPSDIGRPLLDITHHLTYPNLHDDIEEVFDTLQPLEREIRGSDERWYIARLTPYRTAEDHIEGLVLSFIDISMRKAIEEKLFASEQRMQMVAASTKDYAIATLDMDGLVTSWNNGAERLFGYSEKEMLGQSVAKLFTPEDRANGVFEEELRRAREDGGADDDRWHLRSDGSRVFCSGIMSPLMDHEMRGYVKIARDFTGSKWQQDQKDAKLEWEKRERVRAEESARLRDEFFAVLSHELKQPLNLIQLTAEMLSRLHEPVPLTAVTHGTTTIKRMVESQARIIDDLMDLSRLHTGKLTLTRTQVSLTEAVSNVLSLMGAEVQKKGMTLSVETPPHELLIQGDAVRIEQIIWNLLSNAIKFTPTGGTVSVKLTHQENTICMEVIDTGKGISAEFLPSIFDMFRQADTGTTRRFGGMGIGLALVKELTISHGSTLR